MPFNLSTVDQGESLQVQCLLTSQYLWVQALVSYMVCNIQRAPLYCNDNASWLVSSVLVLGMATSLVWQTSDGPESVRQ